MTSQAERKPVDSAIELPAAGVAIGDAAERAKTLSIRLVDDESSGKPREHGQTWSLEEPELHDVLRKMVAANCRPDLTEVSEDLFQEAFLRLQKQGNHSDGTQRRFNATYLWMTATSIVRQTRSDRRRHHQHHQAIDEGDTNDSTETHPGADPERAAISKDHQHKIRACLETLPENHRRAVVLRYRFEYRSREAASLLECSPKDVENWALRGRKKLRGCLKSKGINL